MISQETRIKICGIMDTETAIHCASLNVDYIGFVFAESKRRISADDASKIISHLTKFKVKTVGVFLNASEEEIMAVKAICSLDYIQVHGDIEYSPQFYQTNNVIKASPYNKLESYARATQKPEFILIDSAKPGSGKTFDWDSVNNNLYSNQLFLAGGLNSENVIPAIEKFNPFAVDVSSGVETNGVKDLCKIEQFVYTIRGGTNEL